MPAMSVSTTPAAEDIQRQMRDVRSELREDVQEIVENARIMADWQHYVRSYPWLCLGAAAALGFVLVPPRVQVVKPDSRMLADLVRQHQVAINAEVKSQPPPGIADRCANLASGLVFQAVVALANHQLHQFLQGLSSPKSSPAGGGLDHEESHR